MSGVREEFQGAGMFEPRNDPDQERMPTTMTIFKRNLEVLRQRHPELVNLVRESLPTTHLTMESARNGAPRLRVRMESGRIVDLHDPEDPDQVARGTIE